MLFLEQIDSKIEPFKMRSKQSLFALFARFALSTFSQASQGTAKQELRANSCGGVKVSSRVF